MLKIFNFNNKTKTKLRLSSESGAGFTYIEVIVVVLVLTVLGTIVITNFARQRQTTNLGGTTQDVVSMLRLAQSKTLASKSNSQYGVYFDTSTDPHQYVLFKGANYASRDIPSDIAYALPATMEFSSINFSGGSEVAFDKLTGMTAQSGGLSVRMKLDTSQSKDIFVSGSGSIDLITPLVPGDDGRVKDSRHVHLDYTRPNFVSCPDTDATLSLYFDGAGIPEQTVSVCDNLVDGQLQWEGTVSVGGSNQTVKITTHYLQDINYSNGTQFSFHRDGRLNDKSLRVTISGDASGHLIDYSADGLTTSYTSTYVLNFAWQ